MIKVLDNILPIHQQDEIEAILLSWNFPWYHYANTNYAEKQTRVDDVPQFVHGFIRDDNKNSSYEKVPRALLNAMDIPQTSIIRAKANLLMREPQPFVHPPHTDDAKPHVAFIYYVNESDGDTHFYEDNKVVKTVSPHKGTGVMFDGHIRHSSASPTQHRFRVVMNFNLALGDYWK